MWHFPVNVLCASSLLPSSGTEGSDYLLSEAPLPPPPFSGHARRALAGGTFILSFISERRFFFFFFFFHAEQDRDFLAQWYQEREKKLNDVKSATQKAETQRELSLEEWVYS
jgi:hypothetical protein